MNSALFIHGYTDRTPDAWHLAFDRDINKKRMQINYPHIMPYYMEPHLLEVGITHEICQQDVYIYKITVQDSFKKNYLYQGHFSLIK